ncbi:MAG: hypothetical protein LBR15_05405 [Methanobrevibacter sp.]|jgi:type III restriction enzyme|nr:hypothetical protein [Candidatus Methanovirga australis]
MAIVEAQKPSAVSSDLQYSTTHREIHTHIVYKLDTIDAYKMDLIKQIKVGSFESLDYYNKAYLKFVSVDNKKSPITAKIELDQYKMEALKEKF